MKSNKTYVVHSDPGHAWIAVPIRELFELNIADKITAFSYIKGKTAYLEEDCDLSTFFKAFELRFGQRPQYREGKHWDRCPVRSFAQYTVGAAEAVK